MIRLWGVLGLVCALTFGLGACGGDDGPDNAPASGLVLGEAILQIGPTEQTARLGVGPRALEVTFPAGALPQRRAVTVRSTEPVMRAGIRPAGSTVQIATRSVSFDTPGRMRQTVMAPALRRRYAVVGSPEGATEWVRKSTARVIGAAAGLAGSIIVEGDIEGSGEWALVEESDDVPQPGTMDAMAGDRPILDDAGVPVDAAVIGDVAVPADLALPADVSAPVDAAMPVDVAVAPVDAAVASDVGTLFAQISAVSPLQTTVGLPFTLTVTGANVPPSWVVFFDGNPLATTVLSTTSVEAQVGAALTATQGFASVWLGDPAAASSRTNALYLTIDPTAGAPVVIDYSPDNALPGATISIIGSNFTAEPFTIRDANGAVISSTGTGTTVWVGANRETIDFVLPAGTPSGPLTVSNSKGAYRGKIFNVGQNLSRIAGSIATASSEYNTSNWSIASGWDNNLQTSWFSAIGDCASEPSCTTKPWYQVSFALPQTVVRIAMRGNREYASGYDFLEGTFEIYGAGGAVLWRTNVILPDPDRDIDLTLPSPLSGAQSVRFTSIRDESVEPGFSELQVFGPPAL